MFEILHKYENARLGDIETKYSSIETPAFMPVGTGATVKGINKKILSKLKFKIILSNTYHLMLKARYQYYKKDGGLNKFMSWNDSI